MPVPDYPVPIGAIESFLRYLRNHTDVIAVKIANELLDNGTSIAHILSTERTLHISVVANCDGSYGFHIRCIVGSGTHVVGDGGSWQVHVDSDGNVIRAVIERRSFYD